MRLPYQTLFVRNWPLGIVIVLLLLTSRCLAEKRANEYPLSVTIKETQKSIFVVPSDSYKTNCTSSQVGVGIDTDCTTVKRPDSIWTIYIQSVEVPGVRLKMQCDNSGNFLTAMAQGAAQASGVVNPYILGCDLLPGTYQAKAWKNGYKIRYPSSTKKFRDVKLLPYVPFQQ